MHESQPKPEPREVLLQRERYEVRGVVQGVGFRPYVYRLALEEGLAGFIGNDTGGVTIEIEGPAERVEVFRRRLEAEAPPLARIDSVVSRIIPPKREKEFSIIASDAAGQVSTGIPADAATCADCLRELLDPNDRRYPLSISKLHQLRPALHHHAPHSLRPPADLDGRLHHVRGLPGGIRRSHQPALPRAAQRLPGVRTARLACRAQIGTAIPSGDPVTAAIDRLMAGEILAIKGIGGFHLCRGCYQRSCSDAAARAQTSLRQAARGDGS